MTTPRDPHRADVITIRLRQLQSLIEWTTRGERTGRAIWPTPVLLLVILIIDASLPLHPVVRALLAGLMLILLLRILLIAILAGRRQADINRIARLLEERAGLDTNPVINAIQLRELAQREGIEGELASRAVELGAEAITSHRDAHVVDTSGLRRSWLLVLVAALAIGVTMLLSPRLITMGMPRLMQPFADHPPFTLTDFTITTEPDPVLVGDDVVVRAHLKGPLPAALQLVLLDDERTPVDIAPMSPVTAGGPRILPASDQPPTFDEFELRLRDVREPVRFHLQGSTGRSRTIVITPEPRPRLQLATVTIQPPVYARKPAVTHRLPVNPALMENAEAVEARRGSVATLRLECSMPLGEIETDPTDLYRDATTEGSVVILTMPLDAPGTQTISLRPSGAGPGGLPATTPFTVTFEISDDAPPTLDIIDPARPGQESFVLLDRDVPIHVIARDDIGLGEFTMSTAVTRQGTPLGSPVITSLDIDPARSAAAAQRILATEPLDLQTGDIITLNFHAADNRIARFGGPQSVSAGPVEITVLDEAAFQRRFLDQLTIDSVVQPYEQIVEQTERLEATARDLAEQAEQMRRDVDRLPEDKPVPTRTRDALQDLARQVDTFRQQRDALREQIDQQLNTPPAVSLDEEMREPLEQLRERVDALKAPDVPTPSALSPEASAPSDTDDSADPSDPSAQQDEAGESSPSPSSSSPQPEVRPADVGQWLERLAEESQTDQQQAGVASDEAASDIQRPLEALRLADQLQRTLERVDKVAQDQRILANRLESAENLDQQSLAEFAHKQQSLLLELEEATSQLAQLGEQAARDLPAGEEPAALANAVRTERDQVLSALTRAQQLTSEAPDDLAGRQLRGILESAVDTAITNLFFATDPVIDTLDTLPDSASPDQADTLRNAGPGLRESTDGALKAIDDVERLLEGAENATRSGGSGSQAQMPTSTPLPLQLRLASLALAQVDPVDPRAWEGDMADALANARLQLDRLRATLRQSQDRMTPLLPNMGQSALDLSGAVEQSGAPDQMSEAQQALMTGDLDAAKAAALAAADALEALYEQPGQGQGQGQSAPPDVDRPLSLTRPSDSSQSQSSSSSSSSSSQSQSSSSSQSQSSGGGASSPSGPSDTLSQLSQNRRDGDQPSTGQRPGEQPGSQPGEDQPGARPGDGPELAGQTPQSGEPTPGQPGGQNPGDASSPSASPTPGSANQPGESERARFFNQQLYDQATGESATTTELSDQDAEAETLTEIEIARRAALSGAFAPVGPGSEIDVSAQFRYVPPSYRDLVAGYYLRIAEDQAGTANGRNPR
ncbi:MAG: hypothetical protein KDA21_09185 [Phycisphaerales bacterium]|nr:hypothetical protein [Phycisphaerales bacterium]